MDQNLQFVIQLAVALAGGGLIAPIAIAFLNRNKTKAEEENVNAIATEALSRAAAGIAENYQKMYDRQAVHLEEARTDLRSTRRDLETTRHDLETTRAELVSATNKMTRLEGKLEQAIELLRANGHDVTTLQVD